MYTKTSMKIRNKIIKPGVGLKPGTNEWTATRIKTQNITMNPGLGLKPATKYLNRNHDGNPEQKKRERQKPRTL